MNGYDAGIFLMTSVSWQLAHIQQQPASSGDTLSPAVSPDKQGLKFVWCARQGNRYIPSIVRVGLSVHHSVEAVSLDALVDMRLRSAKASSCTLCSPSKCMLDILTSS